MEYVYAAMLLNKAGKDVSADALTKTLTAAGISVDEARVKATAAALADVDINKVIEETQLASAAPATPAASADTAEESPAEAKEEKTEASEEDVSEGLGALFG
jgi:large subunit ribosomal protein L12